jgi:uncharacterized protein YndB with AHSA1/START domain
MASAENTITINRPLHEVFAFVSEKENDRQWRPSVLQLERISGDGTVGSQYHQVMKGPGGREVTADFEVTTFEPGKRYAFRATEAPVPTEGSYDFVEEDGATRVTFKLDAELTGAGKLIAPFVGKSMRSEVEALERLKQVLETG